MQFAGIGRAPNLGSAPSIPQLGAAPTVGYNPSIRAPMPAAPADIRSMVRDTDQDYERWVRTLLQPEFERQREAMMVDLTNRGLRPGSEAFSRGNTDLADAQATAFARAMVEGREAERQLAYQQAAQNQMVFDRRGQWGLDARTTEAQLRLQKALADAGFIQERDLANQQAGITGAQMQQQRDLTGAGFQQERDLQSQQLRQAGYGQQFDAQTQRDMAEYGMRYTHSMTPYMAQLDRDLAMLDSETARYIAWLAAEGGATASYNSAAANRGNAMMGGLFGLGSTLVGGAFGLAG